MRHILYILANHIDFFFVSKDVFSFHRNESLSQLTHYEDDIITIVRNIESEM